MEQTFLTSIDIKKVRHLKNISIPLDKEKRKHLILTGKNGSGKTSVLETLVKTFGFIMSESLVSEKEIRNYYLDYQQKMNNLGLMSMNNNSEDARISFDKIRDEVEYWLLKSKKFNTGISVNWTSEALLEKKYDKGEFIFAYYKAEREFKVEEYKNIEKIQFQNKYNINENPGAKLTKYLVDLKATQAFTRDNEKK